ncbi:hypothetical protein PRIPAC_83092 [Pristionchus pacificus]|uniref:Uncharacterized protein n=1 Tax=Pristionchus pacificus TaxID=54126 RepID=A0A454Y2F1_PRIPA|nr:hypothetical protein PRIPAC_83092 [Pristionchus pacificus]|eukprot:PDM76503.1 hypothetical protein PRIPAC_42869 [Pristionchus pacificus]
MSAPPYPEPSQYPEPPPTYDEAMGLLPAGGQPLTSGRSHQGSMDDILARSLANSRANSRQSSRQPSPTRHVACPYPLTDTVVIPRRDSPHIIRPYPMGGSTGSIAVLEQPRLEGNGVSWVPKPPEEATCPTGLEYLLDLEYVYVRRERKHFLGALRSFSVRNAYDKMIYLVVETAKVRCAAVDHYEKPVFTYVEDWGIAGENWLELHEGHQIAYFQESFGCITNTQKILDSQKSPVLYLDSECCGENNEAYTIYSYSHATIGSIHKGNLGEKIKIKFPLDLDVRMKAALVALGMRLEIGEERRRGDYS